jgi:hypothetical protein
MIDEILTKVGAAIKGFFSSIFNLDWVPEMFYWYFWLFVLFIAVCAIIWLFGWSKIVRVVASMAFLFGAIFTAGGWYMKRRLDLREDAKPEPPPPPPKPREEGGGFFGGWR